MTAHTLIRFDAPAGDRVRAPQAGYVVGLLDVAGYAVRGRLPADALEFRKALKILGITKREGLIARDDADTFPGATNTVFVRMGSLDQRPALSRMRAAGAGTADDPIVHDGDPIATGRAILAAVDIPDATESGR